MAGLENYSSIEELQSPEFDENPILEICKRRTGDFRVVDLTKENACQYTDQLCEIVKDAFPEEFQISPNDILEDAANSLCEVAFGKLYFRKEKAVAFSLFKNLECCNPLMYGVEVALFPDYLKFNTCYVESIAVIKEEDNIWIPVRMLLEVKSDAIKQGFKSLLAHTLMSNNTNVLVEKLGCKQLYVHKNFFDTGQDMAFVYSNLVVKQ